MNTNVTKPISLQKLTYSDIVQNLGHVSFGNYYLPENDDSCTTVNNEYSFERWKSRIACRYPNAVVELNPEGSWSKRVILIDKSFDYDKNLLTGIKSQIAYEDSIH
ncbi:hypothetical protein [Sphingobacterium yanglingense]|uniref:Uncharacterized protein n=1 Tax=Sphingobacterium yanglingense TaxID=1437280 RepID=A0A4R6WS73_9SPHI|nr:hypothetical protein [Sphingobacterium yanglingense]TDQ79526.1 hypothetical protein CLV99_0968 [Sphingobacterium yanglingense]